MQQPSVVRHHRSIIPVIIVLLCLQKAALSYYQSTYIHLDSPTIYELVEIRLSSSDVDPPDEQCCFSGSFVSRTTDNAVPFENAIIAQIRWYDDYVHLILHRYPILIATPGDVCRVHHLLFQPEEVPDHISI